MIKSTRGLYKRINEEQRKQITVTKANFFKLRIGISDYHFQVDRNAMGFVHALEQELNRAILVDSDVIAPDVITIQSIVSLKDLRTGKVINYELVLPEDVDIDHNMISILSPLGCAIFGYRVNDIVELKTPEGLCRLKVDKISYQPESSENFDFES